MRRHQLLSTTTTILLSLLPIAHSTPITCLTNSTCTTIESLVACFNDYTVPANFYDQSSYDAAQPNATESTAWTDAITSLLWVDNNCSTTAVPSILNGVFTISLFNESVPNGGSYCVLSEVDAGPSGYTRGWGLAIVPASRAAVSRFVHFSTPEPVSLENTPLQSVTLFASIGAKSLLISGRDRRSYNVTTPCVAATPGTEPFYVTR